MEKMTSDDVLEWIAKKNVEMAIDMLDCSNEQWKRHKGACDALKELRHYILIKTNPHNREDIKRFNEKNE